MASKRNHQFVDPPKIKKQKAAPSLDRVPLHDRSNLTKKGNNPTTTKNHAVDRLPTDSLKKAPQKNGNNAVASKKAITSTTNIGSEITPSTNFVGTKPEPNVHNSLPETLMDFGIAQLKNGKQRF
jgi:hypothetical protein